MPQFSSLWCKLPLVIVLVTSLRLSESASQPQNPKDITKFPILIPKEVVTTEPSLVRPYEEEMQANQPGGIHPPRGRIHSADLFLRKCGDIKEKCARDVTVTGVGGTDEDNYDGDYTTYPTTTTTMRSIGRPKNIDYLRQPFYCRCDDGVCDDYGDCCWTIAKTLLYQNPWRCHRVQDQNVWALMISRCSNQSSPFRKACEGPDSIGHKQRSHLHDIPVYAKQNGKGRLFRNIYCAECNGVSNSEISHMSAQLKCSHNYTQNELEMFVKSAVYKPGLRLWSEVGGEQVCSIYIPKFDHKKFHLNREFPEIRYCRRQTIEDCPEWYAYANPLETALCSSYTQVVSGREGIVYKNPHCALCHGVENSTNNLLCQHDKDLPARDAYDVSPRLSPHQAGAGLKSAGLTLIYDFDFKVGSFAGFESVCPGNMMWDFVHMNCTPTQCNKGSHLNSDGDCVPEEEDLEDSYSSDNLSSSNPNSKTGGNGTPESCYSIILHENEYTLLLNLSVIVNRTVEVEGRKSFEILMFHPGEYSKWNETAISICARDLHVAFPQRFSPVLNYISMAALAISVFFSSLHILLFVFIPKMRNLPGKNLFCLTFSLLVSQSVFLVFIMHKADGICVSAAIVMHYFFLSSFFWMNIMSFDIWRTFSGEFMQRRPGSSSGKTFVKYSLYAWVLPGLIVVCAAILDLWAAEIFQNGDPSDIWRKLRPLYGHNNVCWITQGLPLFIFFALPVVILISTNIVLFLITAKAIHDQRNDSQKVFKGKDSDKGDSRSRKDGEDVDRMKLYTKLGVIMGVGFILGFLSELPEFEWIRYPFVIVNGLQGTFIFFAFDWKRTVWEMLKEQAICFARFRKDTRDYGITRQGTTSDSTTATTSVGPTLRSFHGRPET